MNYNQALFSYAGRGVCRICGGREKYVKSDPGEARFDQSPGEFVILCHFRVGPDVACSDIAPAASESFKCYRRRLLGIGFASNTHVNDAFLLEIAGSWIAVPFVCALVSFVIYELVMKAEERVPLVTMVRSNRMVLLVVVFFLSFTLGANNLGLVESFASDLSNFIWHRYF